MPAAWDEFTVTELAALLGESRGTAEGLLDLAHDLEVKLPGTKAAFRDGTLRASKVEIIARAAAVLDPAEARAAEALVLGRAGRLTPGGLRAAIARAVMEVAPEKARKRREAGGAGRAGAAVGRGLRERRADGPRAPPGRGPRRRPADHRVGAGAEEGRAWTATWTCSAPAPTWTCCWTRTPAPARTPQAGRTAPAGGQAAGQGQQTGQAAGPAAGRACRPGSPGRITLTVPLATLLDLADRPGEIPGIGPIDPWLARDLARAAAANPKTTWCVTVTDEQGHAIGHGCARPEPRSHARRRDKPGKHGPPDGRDPPPGPAAPPGRDSPSRPPASTGRPADTAPGGCAPGPADRAT